MRGLLAAALVVAVGCGKRPEPEADPSPAVRTEPTRKAAAAQPASADDYVFPPLDLLKEPV
jgi:hypothetical protein